MPVSFKYDPEEEIKAHLSGKFDDRVKIEFDKDKNPDLIFKDGETDKFKWQVIRFVENLYKRMGWEVVFFPEQERVVE